MRIQNDGPNIIAFDPPPDFEAAGKFLLSFNACACRVILPRVLEHWIAEMETGEVVHVTREPWRDAGGVDALRLMYDDGSENPFTLWSALDGVIDTLPSPEDHGRADLVSTVWVLRRGQPHRSLIRPATYEDLRKRGKNES